MKDRKGTTADISKPTSDFKKPRRTENASVPRKRAVDYFEEEKVSEEAPVHKKSKSRVSKAIDEDVSNIETREEEKIPAGDVSSNEASDVEGEIDHTAALLKGFESSDDESEGDEEGVSIEKIPKLPKDKALRKKLEGAKSADEPGVIFVG